MSSSESTQGCHSRCCQHPTAGVSSICGLPLCQQHLDKDRQKAASQVDEFVGKVGALHNFEHIQKLRTEKKMLKVEIKEVTAMFDEVQETLEQWRNRTLSRIQAIHDAMAGRLKDATDAEEAVKEISAARTEDKMRQAMEIIACMEPWLDEAVDRLNEFERDRSELLDRQSKSANVRCVGDVSGGVRQLHLVIDRHMAGVMQHCWLQEADVSEDKSPTCRLVSSVDGLESRPRRLALCDNTAGFVGDSSGRVVRAETGAENCTPLPQPCIIVTLNDSPENRLLVTSVSGDSRFEIRCGQEIDGQINGLHWDSQRQLLFASQMDSVRVMDLSGSVSATIRARSLEQSVVKLSDVDGNSRSLFVLDTERPRIFLVDKSSLELKLAIDLEPLKLFTDKRHVRMCVIDSKLLVTDIASGQVHKLCSVSRQLIVSYPTQCSSVERFKCPRQVAVNNRGLLAVIDLDGELMEDKKIAVRYGKNAVHILANDGASLHTVTQTAIKCDSSAGLSSRPSAVLFVKSQRDNLVVADFGAKRLLVFELT